MNSPHPSRRALAGAAVALLALAALLAWAAATEAPALRVPAVVAYAVAWCLGLGALRALQLSLVPGSAGDGLAALLLAGLAGVGAWIALGPGTRACAVGPSLRATTPLTGLACRVPFGFGALLTALLAAYAAQRWWRARRGASAHADA